MKLKKRAPAPPPPSYEPGWVSKQEAIGILDKSDSTLERLVTEKLIVSKRVPRPGKVPERVYNEQSLREIKERLNRRRPEPEDGTVVSSTPAGAGARRPDTAALLRDAMREILEPTITAQATAQRLQTKLWLNVQEAAAYSGLGVGAVLALVASRDIVGRRAGPHGALVVRRKSLEEFGG